MLESPTNHAGRLDHPRGSFRRQRAREVALREAHRWIPANLRPLRRGLRVAALPPHVATTVYEGCCRVRDRLGVVVRAARATRAASSALRRIARESQRGAEPMNELRREVPCRTPPPHAARLARALTMFGALMVALGLAVDAPRSSVSNEPVTAGEQLAQRSPATGLRSRSTSAARDWSLHAAGDGRLWCGHRLRPQTRTRPQARSRSQSSDSHAVLSSSP